MNDNNTGAIGANGEDAQPRGLSFEYFPPANDLGAQRLWQSIQRHGVFNPDFISVTYGAGGTTQDRTLNVLEKVKRETNLRVAGHLTCVGKSRAEVMDVVENYARLGVDEIVALRGDPPKGETVYTPHPDGFQNATDLTQSLHARGGFKINVGAYPEIHPDSPDFTADILNLKQKCAAGADRAISQFFFEKDVFLRFRDACADAGIETPIVPGILPVENFTKMCNFAARCGSSVPQWMHNAFENCQTDAERYLLSVTLACELVTNLKAEGVEHFHFYTLNNPQLVFDICTALGYETKAAAENTRVA